MISPGLQENLVDYMKKLLLFICSLLPVLSIIIPSPVLADSKTLPTGDNYEQIGQKIEDFYKKNEKIFHMSWENFSHLGIWKQPNAPFICIEPWD